MTHARPRETRNRRRSRIVGTRKNNQCFPVPKASLGRNRLDDGQIDRSREYLVETEARATKQLAVFLDGTLFPAGHEHHENVSKLSY